MPRRIVQTVFSIVLFLTFLSQPAHAIGLSSGGDNAISVLRGVVHTDVLTLSRAATETGILHIQVSAEGEFASNLIFEPSFDFLPGKSTYNFPFKIDPKNLPTGDYVVLLSFLSIPEIKSEDELASATVGIYSSATAKVFFSVTGEEVLSYVLDGVNVRDTESDDFVTAEFSITNTGNVDWKPDRIDVKIQDVKNPNNVVTNSIAGDALTMVGAGQSSTQVVELKQLLLEGAYILTAYFFDNDILVGTLTSTGFDVYAPGTMLQTGDLTQVTANKTEYELGEKILLNGVFENTGELPINATLYTEVTRDDTYEDLIRGEEIFVDVSQTMDFSQVVPAKDAGTYTLNSYIKYANKKTAQVTTVVEVKGGALAALNTPVGIGSAAGVSLLGFILLALKRRGISPISAGKKIGGAVAGIVKRVSTPRAPAVKVKPQVKVEPTPSQTPSVEPTVEPELPSDDSTRGW